MKKLLALTLVLALTVVCTAFAETESKDLLARIQERGTLIIGTEGNWDPWTYHDENDILTGLDVEIGKRLAAYIGVEAEFAEAEWSGLLDGVKAGRFDIVCNGVGYTATRAEVYSFSTPYVYSGKYLIVRADNEEIATLEDLDGKTTAASPSSTYAMLAEANGATVNYTESFQDCVQQLEQGRVDALINSKASFESYMAAHPEANIKVAAVLPGDPVAFPMDNTEDAASLVEAVNAALEEMRADGSLAELCIQFMGEDLTQEIPAE